MRQIREVDNLHAKGLLSDKNYSKAKDKLIKTKTDRELEILHLENEDANRKRGELEELYRFTKKETQVRQFNAKLFEKFILFAEINGRESITFHLTAGLKLKEKL